MKQEKKTLEIELLNIWEFSKWLKVAFLKKKKKFSINILEQMASQ